MRNLHPRNLNAEATRHWGLAGALLSAVLIASAGQALSDYETTFVDCRLGAANLKTGERIEVSDADVQFGFRGTEILDEEGICNENSKLSYEISSFEVFLQCRGEDVSYEHADLQGQR